MKALDFSKRQRRDALRLALQSSSSAAILFTVMQSLAMPEKFVGVLSAVLVLSPGLGATLGSAWQRLAATLIGAVLGALALWILPDGYGTAISLAVSIFVIGGVAGLYPQWQYGIVAAVALALGSEQDVVQTAVDRSLAIGLGVIVGSLVSLVVWPQRSSDRAEEFLKDAVGIIGQILKLSLSKTDEKWSDDSADKFKSLRNEYSSMISQARDAAQNVRFAGSDGLMDQIDYVERVHHSLEVVQRIAEDENNFGDEGDDLIETLDAIRDQLEDISSDVADGTGSVSKDDIQDLKERVNRVRELSGGDDHGNNWHHVHLAALAYALSEIAVGIENLTKLGGNGD